MRAVNLRALLTDDSNLSGTVPNLITSMEAIEREDARGSHLAYLLDPTLPDFVIDSNALPIELSDDHLRQILDIVFTFPDLVQPLCLPRQASSINIQQGCHPWNVYFPDLYIYEQQYSVLCLQKLCDFGGGDRRSRPITHVIHISHVASHFALTPIDDGPYMPVDRLMPSYSMDDGSGRPDEDVKELTERAINL
ncbi:hypothetical protein C0995_000412 [Termitomyces sp. Mi166|nr:hypothetical protein C0995_000412 [Termitomyces sp. Mi166\